MKGRFPLRARWLWKTSIQIHSSIMHKASCGNVFFESTRRMGITFCPNLMMFRAFGRTGIDFMLFLLTQCDIFVELPNACFFQLAGHPAADRLSFNLPAERGGFDWLTGSRGPGPYASSKRPLGATGLADVQPKKRRKHRRQTPKTCNSASNAQPPTKATGMAAGIRAEKAPFSRTPCALTFGRSNMLYARATHGHKGSVWFGLPRHRWFHRVLGLECDVTHALLFKICSTKPESGRRLP